MKKFAKSFAQPSRRGFLAALGMGLAGAGCQRQPQRPNVVFVLADDWSWAHAGVYGSKMVRTPHFDKVAREGALFRHAFTASPSCTPSRTSILTGRNQWQTGEAGVLYGAFPAESVLYTHLLEDAGYHVGWTGKGWAPGDWKAAGMKRHPLGKEYNKVNYGQAVSPGYSPGDYVANFEEFLKDRPAGAPFCFWFGSKEPHRAFEKGIGVRQGRRLEEAEVPPFLPDTPEIRSDLLDYATEVEWLDTQLGRLIETLERRGEARNTLLIVTSDNGMAFPRAKANLYDWGTRMPLAMRWPERIPAGTVVDGLVSHIDFGPTMLEAAGVAKPAAMAGRSLLNLKGSDRVFSSMERHVICRPNDDGYPMRALRTADYLYIRNFAPDRWPTGGPEFVSSNKTFHGDIDEGPAKTEVLKATAELQALALGKRPAEELYDLKADQQQMKNVAGEAGQAARVTELRGQLEAYLRATKDPRMEGQDPWREYPYRQTDGFGATFNKALTPEQRQKALEKASHKPE